MDGELLGMLQSAPLFSGLSCDVLAQVAARSRRMQLPAGEWLFEQGDPSDAVFLVVAGRLEVLQNAKGPPTVVRLLGPGSPVGELGVLTGSPRSAGVRAMRDTELVRLDHADLDQLLLDLPEMALRLTRVLARQLQMSRGFLSPAGVSSQVLSLLWLVRDTHHQFCRHLTRALEELGTVVVLDEPTAGDTAAYGRLLDRCESGHDLVVLVTVPHDTERWRRFCLRQADQLLVVTPPEATPAWLAADAWSGEHLRARLGGDGASRNCHLAFFSTEASPAQRAPWLDALAPRSQQLLRPGAALASDVARLARRITNRSLGVVLSGGGARGLAHIGALEVLLNAGLEIDRVGGASMGAFIAALFASGRAPDEMIELCRCQLVERSPFTDYTLPRVALLRARKAEAMLRDVFADSHLEELPLDCFTVSCDLVSAKIFVHRRGPLWRAVGTSMSIPGLVPPVREGPRLLVDGGLLDNMPVDLMAAEPGPLVAVDVMGRGWQPRMVGHSARPIAGGWRAELAHLLGRGQERLPTIAETLTRATVLGSWRQAEENRRLADLLIVPEVEGTGVLEFRRLDEMVEAGRRAARQALTAWTAGSPTADNDRTPNAASPAWIVTNGGANEL